MERKMRLAKRMNHAERAKSAADFARGFTQGAARRESDDANREPLPQTLLDGLINTIVATFANQGWEIPRQPSTKPILETPLLKAFANAVSDPCCPSPMGPAFKEFLQRACEAELDRADSPDYSAKIVYSYLLAARRIRDSDPQQAIELLSLAAWEIANLVLLLERQPRKKGAANLAKTTRRSILAKSKEEARIFWLECRKRPEKWQGSPLFAAECVRRWPELKQSTIERKWIPQWEKDSRTHHAS